MKKSRFSDVLVRRLGLRRGRLNSLVQRAAELGHLPMAIGTSYPQLEPIELARMLLVGICDEGLGSVSAVIQKYGGLAGPGATLEEVLGHSLTRPASFVPSISGLEIHADDNNPYAVLTIVTADGARTLVFGEMPAVEGIERMVSVPGATLYAIAAEIAGRSPADVDALLQGAEQVQRTPEAVAA
jgi:hypothetical protein